MQIRSFRTSHDAKESVGYRIESSDGSLAVLTDTGFITDDAHDAALGANMLLLESNHDVIMLKTAATPIISSSAFSANAGIYPTKLRRNSPWNASAPARATFCSRT